MVDPIERRIELALRPCEYIGDSACFSFVSGLDRVAAEVQALTGSVASKRTRWISGQMTLHRINGYRDLGGKEKAAA